MGQFCQGVVAGWKSPGRKACMHNWPSVLTSSYPAFQRSSEALWFVWPQFGLQTDHSAA
jgi:hypothetical protein